MCRTPECGRSALDTPAATVCATCAHRLALALDDVPHLAAELDTAVARLTRRGRCGGRTPSADPLLPFDPDAAIIRDALSETLGTWASVLSGDVLGPAPAATSAGLAAWLSARMGAIRRHVDGGHIVDEITAAVGAARDEVHGPDRSARMLAGACPACGTPVYAPQGAREARCHRDGCGGMVDAVSWRYAAIQGLRSAVLPAVDAARAASLITGREITAARVRQWRRRGRIVPAGTGPGGNPHYLVADICDQATNRGVLASQLTERTDR
jgi:hypothetical protein